MADIIQLLPESLANQIAAGEVVQRPASVIKELMENAVDAGAESIKIIIKDAGKTLIQVIDDGGGMSETDARMCFERHATSKIKENDDLFAIMTMGFRGEAMASIAAVSHVELKTRRAESELGTRIVMDSSKLVTQEPCQCPKGTNLAVKNLFHNVPARRNFLKSDHVELKHIEDEFKRIALSFPEKFFSLHSNGQEMYHLPSSNLRTRIEGLFKGRVAKALLPVMETNDLVTVYGFIVSPEAARKSRGHQYFFVNNRFIKSSYLHHAVKSAFDELLPKDSYPGYFLYLEMAPKLVDVNVHPTKQEIKFEDERLVYNYVRVAVRHALGRHAIVPTLDFEGEQAPSFIDQPESSGDIINNTKGNSPFNKYLEGAQQPGKKEWEKLYEGIDRVLPLLDIRTEIITDEEEMSSPETAPNTASMIHADEGSEITEDANAERLISDFEAKNPQKPYQLQLSYILQPIKSGFLLIDQQYAHERVLYERYLLAFSTGLPAPQRDLFPKTWELSPTDAQLVTDLLPSFKLLGFDIEDFGNNTFIIHGVPSELVQQDEIEVLDQILESYKINEDLKSDLMNKLARSMAKTASIKRGQSLTPFEMQTLVDQLFATTMPQYSPSGKSCFLTYSIDDIAAQLEKGQTEI